MPDGRPDLAAIHTVVFDFDGVFTDNRVWVDQDGKESVACDRRDGLGLDLMRAWQRMERTDAELFILSKEPNEVVSQRARKLQLDCHQGVGDKLAFMRDYLAERHDGGDEAFSGVAYLGNDLNDLPLMRRAGYAVAPADAHPRVRAVSHLVLDQPGGHGCVRAFIELLLDIDRLSEEELDELVSDS